MPGRLEYETATRNSMIFAFYALGFRKRPAIHVRTPFDTCHLVRGSAAVLRSAATPVSFTVIRAEILRQFLFNFAYGSTFRILSGERYV